METLDIPVVELLRGSIALPLPLRYRGQRILFDESPQVKEGVFECILVFYHWIPLSCSTPRMTSANSWLRIRSCCQCRRSPCRARGLLPTQSGTNVSGLLISCRCTAACLS